MSIAMPRVLVGLALLACLPLCRGEAVMQRVGVAADRKSFVLEASGQRFVPWGHNYGSVNILHRLSRDKARVEREFAQMKSAGTTVARVHPEMPMLMLGPGEI